MANFLGIISCVVGMISTIFSYAQYFGQVFPFFQVFFLLEILAIGGSYCSIRINKEKFNIFCCIVGIILNSCLVIVYLFI